MAKKILTQEEAKGYSTTGLKSGYKDKKAAVKFVSINESLELHYHIDRPIGDKVEREDGTIQFKYMYFETDDKDIIKILREHNNFGGSSKNEYTNASMNSQPLFYEGDYPKAVRDRQKLEQSELTRNERSYEPDKEDVFTESDKII